MISKFNLKNAAGYDDYHKSIDNGVEDVNRAYSKLNPDQYYYNLGIQNYWLGTPRVLTKKEEPVSDVKRKVKKVEIKKNKGRK